MGCCYHCCSYLFIAAFLSFLACILLATNLDYYVCVSGETELCFSACRRSRQTVRQSKWVQTSTSEWRMQYNRWPTCRTWTTRRASCVRRHCSDTSVNRTSPTSAPTTSSLPTPCLWAFCLFRWGYEFQRLFNHTPTRTHPFNSPLSGTIRVSRYQIGITNLDFTEAIHSEWQWHQLGHMQVCTSLQTDNHASTPSLSFLQTRCPSCCQAESVKALILC